MFDTFYRPGMASCPLRKWLGVHSQCMLDSFLFHSFSEKHVPTSSNGGVFGSLYGTPIINLPQAAVLGNPFLFTYYLYFLIELPFQKVCTPSRIAQ